MFKKMTENNRALDNKNVSVSLSYMKIEKMVAPLIGVEAEPTVFNGLVCFENMFLRFRDGTRCEILPSIETKITPHLLGVRVLSIQEAAAKAPLRFPIRVYKLGRKVWTYESELVAAVEAI